MVLTSLRAASPAALPAVLRILVVERSPAAARGIRRALEREPALRVQVARSAGAAARLAVEEPIDALLVEEHAWNGGASTLGRIVREHRPDIAVLLITDSASAEAGLGVHDCLTREELAGEQLVARIAAAVAETRGARRRETMVRWLERDARTDRSSGLFNRASFHDRVREAARASAESGEPVTVVAIEIEVEAPGRDEHGALKETVVRRAAASVARAIRSADFAARTSEATLGIVLPGAGIELGRRIARRIAQETDRLNNEAWPDEPPVALAFGVASGCGCTAEELIAAAERNLERARERVRRPADPSGYEERDGPSVA